MNILDIESRGRDFGTYRGSHWFIGSVRCYLARYHIKPGINDEVLDIQLMMIAW